jgi:adenylate cyclase
VSVLLIDSDPHSAAVLLAELQQQDFGGASRVGELAEVPQAAARLQPALVVFNHHFDRPDEVLACSAVRLAAPQALIVALAAAGPTLRQLRQWAADTRAVDAVLEKPLPPGQLRARLAEMAARAGAEREQQLRTRRLTELLPEGALAALDGEAGGPEELFPAAVLFTDVRRSSDLITRTPPRDYFRLLNETLSAQAALVRSFRGAVVKYTGDGLMAVFRGTARAHLALRCATALARSEAGDRLPFGVGVAEGLALAGLVGDSAAAGQRRQYDVIGATVHLAARLCAMAGEAEVVTTRAVYAAARLELPRLRLDEAVTVRGFPAPIACVAFQPRLIQESV